MSKIGSHEPIPMNVAPPAPGDSRDFWNEARARRQDLGEPALPPEVIASAGYKAFTEVLSNMALNEYLSDHAFARVLDLKTLWLCYSREGKLLGVHANPDELEKLFAGRELTILRASGKEGKYISAPVPLR